MSPCVLMCYTNKRMSKPCHCNNCLWLPLYWKDQMDLRYPHAIFSSPRVAAVGFIEQELKEEKEQQDKN